MIWNKKKRQDFLWKIKGNIVHMPRVFKLQQVSIFDDPDEKRQFYHLSFSLCYPDIENNPNHDPIPKQSYRNYLAPTGEVIGKDINGKPLYKQMVKGYQTVKITGTSASLADQIRNTLKDEYPNFKMFTKDVHITRLEFIHHIPSTMSKRDIDEVKRGNMIFFKSTEPDIDNMQKLLWDACEDAGVFKNDGQIASLNSVFKYYGFVPGVIVDIEGRL